MTLAEPFWGADVDGLFGVDPEDDPVYADLHNKAKESSVKYPPSGYEVNFWCTDS